MATTRRRRRSGRVTERTLRRWQQAARTPKGRARWLRRLERELRHGVFAHGYAGDYWTLDRIARLIWQLFSVRYTCTCTSTVVTPAESGMCCIGWAGVASDLNDGLLPRRRSGRPLAPLCLAPEENGRELGATLVFADETGFSQVSALKRT
jgi:hypothetical protein